MRNKHFAAILVLLALAVPASPAQAGGVVSVCDEAHLLAALAGGGTVTFTCSGTITLTAEIVIAIDTTIDGSGQVVAISGNDAVGVFTVEEWATLNLNTLTIADGNAQGSIDGGIHNYGTLTVSNSTFSGNDGGGIVNSEHGTLTVNNCTFSGNNGRDGGGIHNWHGTVTVSNSTFSGNSGGGIGGGIANYTGNLTATNSTFFNNSARDGGGIYNYYGTVTVSNGTFSNNRAGGGVGGGIHSYGTLTVTNSSFSGNNAFNGGGIYNGNHFTNDGTVGVFNSTFSGNSADNFGGGIFNGGDATVSNSTFFGNEAFLGLGGGIFNYSGYTVTVSNSTFANNLAGGGFGGGIYSYGTAILKNTIIANSRSSENCSVSTTDGGGNLSYPDTTCPGINGDPVLGPLLDNGGPTWTMALGLGSAAIDAGVDATCAADPVNNLDQRGVVRPQGPHCDIGAVERQVSWLWFPFARAQ